jgi:hypothetical protein
MSAGLEKRARSRLKKPRRVRTVHRLEDLEPYPRGLRKPEPDVSRVPESVGVRRNGGQKCPVARKGSSCIADAHCAEHEAVAFGDSLRAAGRRKRDRCESDGVEGLAALR